jgi:uncharacterized protein YyaL (SSP411 family)
LLAAVNSRYLPNSVLAAGAPADPALAQVIPLLADRPLKDGLASAYVCQNYTCQAPVTSAEELAALL